MKSPLMPMPTLAETTIEKKRKFAQERAERLKDPKIRHMGIDKQALDDQVKEKRALQAAEQAREDYFNKQAVLMDRHAQVLQQEVDAIRMNRERGVNDYRNTFQKRHMGRDWDLNDPERFKKDIPARVGDDDPRCGPSSLQCFDGEDLDYETRKRAQALQQKAWANAQTDEKIMTKWAERDANRQYDDRNEEMARRAWEIGQSVAAQRAQAAATTAAFNKALAEQQRQEAALAKARDTQKKLEEIHNELTSDFLNETESTVNGSLGSTIKAERFKGFTEEQLRKIYAEQAAQREALRRRAMEEAEEERQLAQQHALDNRMAITLDRQLQREQRAANEALDSERRAQAAEAAEQRRKLDALYSNAVGEEYFKPFGQCMR